MIAAIDRSQQVVWGIGKTAPEALADAHREIASKSFNANASLEIAPLSPDADLKTDGQDMYQYIVEQSQPMQEALF